MEKEKKFLLRMDNKTFSKIKKIAQTQKSLSINALINLYIQKGIKNGVLIGGK